MPQPGAGSAVGQVALSPNSRIEAQRTAASLA